MFHAITIDGQIRAVRLSRDPEGCPHVTDDFGCSWPVAEFDVTPPPVVEAPVVPVVDTVTEAPPPKKRERKAKPEPIVDKDKARADALMDAAVVNGEADAPPAPTPED